MKYYNMKYNRADYISSTEIIFLVLYHILPLFIFILSNIHIIFTHFHNLLNTKLCYLKFFISRYY